MRRALTACALLCLPAATLPAAEKDAKQKAALTPAEAGPDFKIQGEYAGPVLDEQGKRKFGVQVIALGDGKFRAVGYPGGLPGAGWNGEKKVRTKSRREDGQVVFFTDEGTGTLEAGKLIIRNNQGIEVGRLKKTVRKSPTLGQEPPDGAVVLFDGSTAEKFEGGEMTENGLLKQGATSKQRFRDFKLHLEFRTPFKPHARGQARGNSGVYMQGRHEVQVLDSFGLKGRNNECGGIYGVKAPEVNMCLPPLAWQTYDVDFTAARFNEDGEKIANARMTVRHNGVLIHEDVEVPKATRAAPVKEGPEPGPLYIQDHGNPLRFRNIWIVEK